MDHELQRQKEQLKKQPRINVVDACGLENGILKFSDDQLSEFSLRDFSQQSGFFIPASGAGSRMFGFLFQFLIDGIETDDVKTFFRKLEEFPFFPVMKDRLGETYEKLDQKGIVSFLLSSEGMDLSELPKGLIPFHQYGEEVLVPFIEHLQQVGRLNGFPKKVHYTVQKEFLDEIDALIESTVEGFEVSYSFQDESTNAFCFDVDGIPIERDGKYLRRPAGHGALLQNLDECKEEVLFVKNIDNIQPRGEDLDSLYYWRALNGLLRNFKDDLKNLRDNFSELKLQLFNQSYQMFKSEELDQIDVSYVEKLCARPSRVCGMVINEGAPGGGPFWVKENGVTTKQIVEKVQFGQDESQLNVLSRSTHFNPVFMVVDKRAVNGEICSLREFVDQNAFIRVEKDQKGQKVIYHELPGLWNGSMAYWNTIFVEVPKTVFTPVKTVLDLVGREHHA